MKTTKKLICPLCGKKFERCIGDIHKEDKFNYCSKKCKTASEYKRISKFCHTCNKPIEVKLKELKKSKSGFSFCSKSCAAIYNNKLKRKSRRSKIEIKLFNELKQTFTDIDFMPNDKTMLNGLEVDIAVPSLKLAIEWNGVVHFKPIYGQNKLDKIQSIDQQKQNIAQQKNINLIVIPDLVSNDKIFKQAFEQIKNIIINLKSNYDKDWSQI